MAGYVAAILDRNPEIRAVVGDVGGPLAALVDRRGDRWLLKGTRVSLTAPTVKELGAAHTTLLDAVTGGQLRHNAQPQLAAAVDVAGKRPLGDTGLWVFSRVSAVADITPIQAATLALLGAQKARPRKPAPRSGASMPAGGGSRRRMITS